jgi:hypothetical protein
LQEAKIRGRIAAIIPGKSEFLCMGNPPRKMDTGSM